MSDVYLREVRGPTALLARHTKNQEWVNFAHSLLNKSNKNFKRRNTNKIPHANALKYVRRVYAYNKKSWFAKGDEEARQKLLKWLNVQSNLMAQQKEIQQTNNLPNISNANKLKKARRHWRKLAAPAVKDYR